MKKKLINTWYDLYDMRCVGVENYERKKKLLSRVETALWDRYRYDISLTKQIFYK